MRTTPTDEAVYTTDCEVVPRPCKICDWVLDSFRDHFGLHQGDSVRVVTMEFDVSERHVARRASSTDMVQWVLRWERQKRCSSRKRQEPMTGKCCYDRICDEFFYGGEKEIKTRGDQRMAKLLNFFSRLSFLDICWNKRAQSLFGAWPFLLVHIRFTPSERPKDFVNWLLKKLDHGSWTMETSHLPWSDFMVHGSARKVFGQT